MFSLINFICMFMLLVVLLSCAEKNPNTDMATDTNRPEAENDIFTQFDANFPIERLKLIEQPSFNIAHNSYVHKLSNDISGISHRSSAIMAYDYDQDSDQDILQYTTEQILLWENIGDGNFKEIVLFNIPTAQLDCYTFVFEVALLNDDEQVDFIIECKDKNLNNSHHSHHISIITSQINGQYAIQEASIPYEQLSNLIDFDHDGDLDFIIILDNELYFANNDGHANLIYEKLPIEIQKNFSFIFNSKTLKVNDIDSDGQLDLTLIDDGILYLYQLNGDKYSVYELFDFYSQYNFNYHVIDFNKDNKLDIVLEEYNSITIFLQQDNLEFKQYIIDDFDESGLFPEPGLFSGSDLHAIEINDLDNDGDNDFVIQFGRVFYKLENLGEHTFSVRTYSNTSSSLSAPKLADLDNDNDLDYYLIDLGLNDIIWFENTDYQFDNSYQIGMIDIHLNSHELTEYKITNNSLSSAQYSGGVLTYDNAFKPKSSLTLNAQTENLNTQFIIDILE